VALISQALSLAIKLKTKALDPVDRGPREPIRSDEPSSVLSEPSLE